MSRGPAGGEGRAYPMMRAVPESVMPAHRCPWYPKGATVCEKDPFLPPPNDRDMLGNLAMLETVVCYLKPAHRLRAADPCHHWPTTPFSYLRAGPAVACSPAQTWPSQCCLRNLGTGTEKVHLLPVVQL